MKDVEIEYIIYLLIRHDRKYLKNTNNFYSKISFIYFKAVFFFLIILWNRTSFCGEIEKNELDHPGTPQRLCLNRCWCCTRNNK